MLLRSRHLNVEAWILEPKLQILEPIIQMLELRILKCEAILCFQSHLADLISFINIKADTHI